MQRRAFTRKMLVGGAAVGIGIANLVVFFGRNRRQTLLDKPPRYPLRLPDKASSASKSREPDADVCSIAFSLLGTHLVSGSKDDKLSVWYPATGRYGVTWQAPPRDGLTSISFCSDNSWLATVSPYRGVKFWAAGKLEDTGEKTFKEVSFNMFDSHPTCVGFRPPLHDSLANSPCMAAIALADNSIRIVEYDPIKRAVPRDLLALETNDPRASKVLGLFAERSSLIGHTDQINAVAFSHDGALLASASDDHSVRIWDTMSGQPVGILRGHSAGVNGIAFSKDGARMASASSDGTIVIWDRRSMVKSGVLRGHADGVLAAVFCGGSDWLASTSVDRSIMLWPLERAFGKFFRLADNPGNYSAIDVSADDKYLASAWGKYVKFWDTSVITSDAKRELGIH